MKKAIGFVPVMAGICLVVKLVVAATENDLPSPPVTNVPAKSANRHIAERVVSKVAPRVTNGSIASPSGLFTGLQGAIVSPDGKRVAFIDFESGRPAGEDEAGKIAVFLDGKMGKSYDHDEIDPPITSWIFSPNSKRLAYLAREEGSNVVVDGHESESYDGVDQDSLRFSPDSTHVAYIVGGDHTVIDAKQGKTYALVYSLIFSRDSKRVAYIASNVASRPSSRSTFIVVNEQEGKIYDEIRNVIFSPDSKKLAYIAISKTGTNQGAFAVVDGLENKRYTGMGDYLKFSPDNQHLLYVAQIAAQKWSVVVDGKEGKVHDAWAIRNPVFSPDSKRVAYVVSGQSGKGERYVVLDGTEGKRYVGEVSLDYVVFSPDSKHIAYPVAVGGYGGEWYVIADDKEGKHYKGNFLSLITYSPDSLQLAYVVNTLGKSFVVLNGQEGEQYDNIACLSFSPDGKYLAYAAYNKQINKWSVIVNGQEGKAFDYIFAKSNFDVEASDKMGGSPIFSSQSLRFDSSDQLHYLAMSRKQLLLVEEKLNMLGDASKN